MAMLRFCFGLVVLTVLVLPIIVRAQDAGPAACRGVVCDLVPGSGQRPVTESDVQAIREAEDARARKVAADFDNQGPDAETARHGRRHAGAGTLRRHAKVALRTAKTKIATQAGPSSAPTRPTGQANSAPSSVSSVEKPLATIFGLAPTDVDPYAAGLKPWLARLSWWDMPALSRDAAVFAVDGYRDPSIPSVQTTETEPSTASQDERDSLVRRATALSIQGFGTLKADLPRS